MFKHFRNTATATSILLFGASLLIAVNPQSAQAAGASKKAAQTFTGEVSDFMCGAKHMEADAAKCTRDCVKESSAYALVVGNTVYKLAGNASGLEALAGEKATVTGSAKGNTITVQSVAAAK